jgi:hypothetical protein
MGRPINGLPGIVEAILQSFNAISLPQRDVTSMEEEDVILIGEWEYESAGQRVVPPQQPPLILEVPVSVSI